MNDINDKRIETERKRLQRLLEEARIPQKSQDILQPVMDNLAWMRIKLDDSRQLIKNSNIVVPYDNGGGQKGIRENPAFRGYVSLWKAYMSGLEKYSSYFPKDAQEEIINTGMTVLDKVMSMKEAM